MGKQRSDKQHLQKKAVGVLTLHGVLKSTLYRPRLGQDDALFLS